MARFQIPRLHDPCGDIFIIELSRQTQPMQALTFSFDDFLKAVNVGGGQMLQGSWFTRFCRMGWALRLCSGQATRHPALRISILLQKRLVGLWHNLAPTFTSYPRKRLSRRDWRAGDLDSRVRGNDELGNIHAGRVDGTDGYRPWGLYQSYKAKIRGTPRYSGSEIRHSENRFISEAVPSHGKLPRLINSLPHSGFPSRAVGSYRGTLNPNKHAQREFIN